MSTNFKALYEKITAQQLKDELSNFYNELVGFKNTDNIITHIYK